MLLFHKVQIKTNRKSVCLNIQDCFVSLTQEQGQMRKTLPVGLKLQSQFSCTVIQWMVS